MTYTHVSLPVSNACLALRFVSCRCVFCFPPFPFCALSLCLQEEGVVSFCKVCAIGLVNTPSRHLPNDTNKKSTPPPPCASPPPLTLLRFSSPTPPLAACATEHTESELPITPLDRLLKLTIPGALGNSGSTHPIPSLYLACFISVRHFSIHG